MADIRNTDDIIDSRDVIERLEELTDERDALQDDADEAAEAAHAAVNDDEPQDVIVRLADEAIRLAELVAAYDRSEKGAELAALQAFADVAEGYASDWRHGATLVRESYFPDYCRDMLEECGDLPRDLPSYVVIDWSATADNLRVDYTEVDFDGVTYLVR